MTKEEIKKIIDLIIIEEKKTLEQVLTLEMFNLWQDTDQQTQLLKSELEQTTSIAKTKTKQVEVLKEEITQLKKQLKEREEENEKLKGLIEVAYNSNHLSEIDKYHGWEDFKERHLKKY